jgi:hypothetical protein
MALPENHHLPDATTNSSTIAINFCCPSLACSSLITSGAIACNKLFTHKIPIFYSL